MSVSRDRESKRTNGVLVAVLALLAASLAVVSCSSVPTSMGEADAITMAPKAAWEYLSDREWVLFQMKGTVVARDIDDREAPTLSFAGQTSGRISGFSGVNRYFGTYELGDGTMTLKITGLTKMAGSPEAMTLEWSFVELANSGPFTYDLAEQALNLYRDGDLVMMFGMRR